MHLASYITIKKVIVNIIIKEVKYYLKIMA